MREPKKTQVTLFKCEHYFHFFVIILYARVGDLDKKNQENPKKKFKKSKAAIKNQPESNEFRDFHVSYNFFCSILSKA